MNSNFLRCIIANKQDSLSTKDKLSLTNKFKSIKYWCFWYILRRTIILMFIRVITKCSTIAEEITVVFGTELTSITLLWFIVLLLVLQAAQKIKNLKSRNLLKWGPSEKCLCCYEFTKPLQKYKEIFGLILISKDFDVANFWFYK